MLCKDFLKKQAESLGAARNLTSFQFETARKKSCITRIQRVGLPGHLDSNLRLVRLGSVRSFGLGTSKSADR